MPPERRMPDDPREWLNRARSNLVRANTMLPGVYLEDLCFDAQQATEKVIKAVLLAHGVTELVSIEEYQRAVAIADAVVQWAEGQIGEGRSDDDL